MLLPIPEASYAVLIGTTRYSGSFRSNPLPAVEQNVHDLVDVLADEQFGGFLRDHCEALVNETDPRRILKAVKSVADKATDVLLVYLAGHAVPKELSGNQLYLFLPDTDDDADELWWHSALHYSEIRDFVCTSRAACRMVVVDTCFSGRVLPEAMGGRAEQAFNVGGAYTLTSVGRNGLASAPSGAKHTAFTGTLIDLLTHGIDDQGPELSLPRVFPRLQAALIASGYPEPHQHFTQTVEHKAVVRNRAVHIARDLPARVVEALASPINTVLVDGLRELDDLYDLGTKGVRGRIRLEVLRLMDHDSRMVSDEAERLYQRIKGSQPLPPPVRPVSGLRRHANDPWWFVTGVALAVLAGVVLWTAGFTVGLAAVLAGPLALLGYAAAVLTATAGDRADQPDHETARA